MNDTSVEALSFNVGNGIGQVSARLLRPVDVNWLLVLGHGAGADMHHPFMAGIAGELAKQGIASLRYNFPYTEQGRKRPDPARRLTATVRSAVETAIYVSGGVPLIAGGKSLGGRMTSLAFAEASLPGVRGLVFLGFPLHAPGKPVSDRADHLHTVDLPMLFLQGSRDRLGLPGELAPVIADLGDRATLRILEGGDHSFGMPKRQGMSPEEVRTSLAGLVTRWTAEALK